MDIAWADKQLPSGVTRQDVCIWTQDSDGPWCGSCGVVWEFIDGGPKDNKTHFCPRCGGVLLAEPFAEDETPNVEVTGLAAAWRGEVMREALVKLAKLGNEPYYGSSIGNQIARDALAKVGADNTAVQGDMLLPANG